MSGGVLRRVKNEVARVRRRIARARGFYFLGMLGPGLIAANAGNDAGGIATYASVGASYGYELCWMMVLITVCLFVVQEMCARMGAVTGKGLSDLIRENFGIRWTAFAMVCILVANGATVVSEFVGIAAAMELFSVPRFVSVPVVAAAIWWIVARGSYRKVEVVFLALTLPFLAYVITAFQAHPDWGQVARHVAIPTFRRDTGYLMLFVATVGTTITPYMQLILQSSVVEKGVGMRQYRGQWWDVLVGSVFSNAIALFIIIATAATLHKAGITVNTAEDAAKALAPLAGRYATVLFAIGLFGASILAAAILPLATAFSVTEAFGWKSGVGQEPGEAPEFYVLFTALIAIGALVTLLPGLPLIQVLIFVQVVNGVFLPVLLVFVVKLAGSREIMGERRNRGLGLWLAWGTTIVVAGLAGWLMLATVVLPVFGVRLG